MNSVSERLLNLFSETHRELRPRSSMPELRVEFFDFVAINNTIRLREGRVLVRLSDLLEGAPEAVLRAIAHILVAKLYRKPIAPEAASRYRRHLGAHDFAKKVHSVREIRGCKKIGSSSGRFYDLVEIFEELNRRHFHGLLGRPLLTWSPARARNLLAHFDPAHNTIMVSRVFDDPRVPRFAIEYILYHEMLHLKHPVRMRGSRRCVHGPAFQADEKLFPQLDEAKRFLRLL